MESSTDQQPKRPTGMTILLVLSLINAIYNIFQSLILYISAPTMIRMQESGELDSMMEPFFQMMNSEMVTAMKDGMAAMLSIDRIYYLIMGVLFIASLIGVLKMFKWDKIGLHIYSIAQICMLINSSVFQYPKMPTSPFLSDAMLTALFILVYYLYFKRFSLENNGKETE